MGQYWKLYNLDKLEYIRFSGGVKLGEFFFVDDELFMTNILLSGQPGHDAWGGNRVILLGDYADTLPADCFTDTDSSILKEIAAGMKSDNSERYQAYTHLSGSCSNITSVNTATNVLPRDTLYVLRNLDKKEYVRKDVVKGYRKYNARRSRPPGLTQALHTLVGWSDDPSAALMYNTDGYIPASGGTTVPLHQGSWAGNHIDIVGLTDEMKKIFVDEGWLDISEEKARHVSDVFACDGY